MKTLLIDNFDSFTYNLYQLIAEVNRVAPVVVRNNELTWQELQQYEFDNIVISPGPGRPERENDFGICSDVLRKADVPVLGVCLGHQGLGYVSGGVVGYANQVMHGRTSPVHHTQSELFSNIPSPFSVVRYHSLTITDVPPELEVTAFTTDGTVMAVRHKQKPLWGVQFHPESICSEYGQELFKNFRDLTVKWNKQHPSRDQLAFPKASVDTSNQQSVGENECGHQLFHRRLPFYVEPEVVFKSFFELSENAFWLDSSLISGDARFSFMGDTSGPLSELVTYVSGSKRVCVEAQGVKKWFDTSVFTYLETQINRFTFSDPGLPFNFNLGYVGYFGYEMKVECGYSNSHTSALPDAQWVLADRVLVFDHLQEVIYLLVLDQQHNKGRAEEWMQNCEELVQDLKTTATKAECVTAEIAGQQKTEFDQVHRVFGSSEYLQRIAKIKSFIREGETYEVCLTNKLKTQTRVNPLNIYSALRAKNPAPYSAYLKFAHLNVLCSSPERFLAIDRNGVVETKPIKGTRKRGLNKLEDEALIADLETNEKDRAENLMIVDLLRNDLGIVSEVGSVQVPKLFDVETYATVHQLVSTIRSHLKRGCSALDCVKVCFPGGSMTGAPKKRTLELLDSLEPEARGIYSGAIGYFAFNGSADLNIVIRTLVMNSDQVEIGVGGAIVDLSDPQQELEETLLKADALIRALRESECNY